LTQNINDLSIIDSSQKDNEIIQIEKDLIDRFNLADIKTYEEYEKIIQSAEELLKETDKYSKEKPEEVYKAALDLVSNLSDNNKDFRTRALATNSLVSKYGETIGKGINARDYANSLSEDDLKILLSGKVIIDKETTKEDIEKQIDAISAQLENDGSLEIVASLRTKLTSGKKLNKKELEEALGEESALAEQYTVFSDFENQSELEQIKSINAVGGAEITKKNERIASAKETAQKKIEYYEQIAEEEEKLRKKTEANGGTALSAEEGQRYEELIRIIEEYTGDAEYLREIAQNGLGFDEIDSTIFDNLISGIDGVIAEADILKSLAEDVGEN